MADGLGMTNLPEPLPEGAAASAEAGGAERRSALSLLARPGTDGIKTRRIAIIVADGVDGSAALELHEALAAEGAVPRFVGVKLGTGAKQRAATRSKWRSRWRRRRRWCGTR